MHMKVGRREGYIKYSGKYIEIYFNLKITFSIIQSPEYLLSTITHIYQDGGMCITKPVGNNGKKHKNKDKQITNSPVGYMPKPEATGGVL